MNTTKIIGGYTENPLTPEQWEKQTGNKLLSYSTFNGSLAMNMPMSYRNKEGVAADLAAKEEVEKEKTLRDKERSLLESAYGQIIGRTAGGMQAPYQQSGQGAGRGGFYGSMSALEQASMRLADAALYRDLISGKQRGSQEMSLQGLRGSQEMSLQDLRGSQEKGMLSTRAELERKSEIEREIRQLERERAEIGSRPWSRSSSELYASIGSQISNLKRQIR